MTKRYWVIGGEYQDPDFRALIPGTETMAGPFEDERKAKDIAVRRSELYREQQRPMRQVLTDMARQEPSLRRMIDDSGRAIHLEVDGGVTPENVGDKVHLRVELQSLWRLPRSNLATLVSSRAPSDSPIKLSCPRVIAR